VKVAEDGTITLPMIDPLPAAGAMPADLEKRIAEKYREANLINAATVTVAVTAPAGTQPVEPATLALRADAPATMPAGLLSPTTAPASDAALVNVVVVIQPSKFPAPAATPVQVPVK